MYKVLARKYRPSKLDEIIGQDIAVRILKNAINLNKLHHAILLSGPMGVGKTSIARIIAKSLNCEKGPTIEPCNVCESCLSISKGRNVDVIEIDGASNRKVDDARQIIESVKYPPLKNRYKIYIVDEVHMLTQEAFNALLKTIEEPPEYVKFIFATTAIEKVPDTILSRCQIMTLKKISKELIKLKLKSIAEKEGTAIENDALDIIAFASFGSMRVAEGYLDRCIAYKQNDLTENDVSQVVGVTNNATINKYFDAIFKKDADCAIELIKSLDDQDVNFEIFIQQCLDFLLSLQNLNVEYKVALLNIYYSALIDIKQKIEPVSVLNVSTYKSVATSELEKIENIIEKISNIDFYSSKLKKNNMPDEENAAYDSSYTEEKSKEQKRYSSSNEIDDDVKLVLQAFEGKIITVEKLNK